MAPCYGDAARDLDRALVQQQEADDLKDLLRSEVAKSKAELQVEVAEVRSEVTKSRAELLTDALRSEQRILQAIAELKTEIQSLDRRVPRLEAPLLRTT